MSVVNGFQVGSDTLKYNYESLENYNTPEFSASSTYNVGDYVMHEGKLYRCTTQITTAAAWDSSKWTAAVLANDVRDNSADCDGLVDHLIEVTDTEPTSDYNQIWIPETLPSGVQVPTYTEFTALEDRVDDVEEAVASVETSTTASKAYAVGDYFWKDDVLYVVTAAIASGGTITVNTNCKAAVLGNDVSSLKSAIDYKPVITWKAGAISSTQGTESDSSTRIRTGYTDCRIAEVESGYKYIIAAYNGETYMGMWNGTGFEKVATWLTTKSVLPTNTGYKYRLVLAKANDSSIEATDGENLACYAYTDTTLTISGAAADAKIVGGIVRDVSQTVRTHSDNIEQIFNAMAQFAIGRNAIDYPSDLVFTSSIKPLIFYDGMSCSTDYDANKYKQNGGRIIYVSNNGSTNEQGSTKETPTTFGKAITLSVNGDTIYILDDIDREHTTAPEISNKSINIEGNGHYIFDGDFIEIAKASDYTNVYYATRSLANGVFDVTDKNHIVSFRKVSSIDEVDATPASYYATSSTVYIHPVNVNGKHLFTVKNNIWLNFDNEDSDVNIYVHDLTLFGCYHGSHVYRTDSSHSVTVCFDKCNFLYGGNIENSENGVSVHIGTNTIFYKCNVCHSARDGINYAGGGSHGVEIDCVCAWNGIGADEHTMNGSTGHEGAKIIRINGSYFENNGANLADVQSGSQSYNICCVAMTPSAPRSDAYNQNISVQQSGATMWLKECIAVGARYDLWCADDASLIAENCAHDTQGGITTNIIDTDPISPSVIIVKGFMKKGIIPFQ